MKKNYLFPLMASVLLCFFLSSCNKNKSPEHVALEFQTALENYDFEGAKQWVTPEASALVDFVAMVTPEEHKTLRKEHEAEVRIDSTLFSSSGDSAMVFLSVLNPIPTNLIEEDVPAAISTEVEQREVRLIKRDGKWLVNADDK